MDIKYIAIDPRPASSESEIEKLDQLKREGYALLGFEVTIPKFAELMTENWDPQHTGGNADGSCVELVFNMVRSPYERLPWSDEHDGDMDKIAMCTVRADLDSLGGMAVLLAWLQSDSSYMKFHFPEDGIQAVAAADKFTKGEWEPRELFQGNDSSELAPIARFVSDFKVPLKDRVIGLLAWLEHGTEPDIKYREAYETERLQIKKAVESGETTVQRYSVGSIFSQAFCAVVESRLRAATSIGYSKAPIVVAINDAFSFAGGEPHRKITICQYGPKYVDLSQVFERLGDGWGGSPTIGGSPQGVDCQTSIEEILSSISAGRRREPRCLALLWHFLEPLLSVLRLCSRLLSRSLSRR